MLHELHDVGLNFELEDRDEFTPENGWRIDDYCAPLPPEPPGPPLERGPWAIARRLTADYEFADPSIVRAVYHRDTPLADRTMLLEARFYGLRFLLGVRVGGVNDAVRRVHDRDARVWGWNYRTLQGHLEMGQMDYEVWKWLDTGETEFRIHAFSKPALIPNPIVRVGFAIFGRWMQKKFARRALERMCSLVRAELEGDSGSGPADAAPVRAAARIDVVGPAVSPPARRHGWPRVGKGAGRQRSRT